MERRIGKVPPVAGGDSGGVPLAAWLTTGESAGVAMSDVSANGGWPVEERIPGEPNAVAQDKAYPASADCVVMAV